MWQSGWTGIGSTGTRQSQSLGAYTGGFEQLGSSGVLEHSGTLTGELSQDGTLAGLQSGTRVGPPDGLTTGLQSGTLTGELSQDGTLAGLQSGTRVGPPDGPLTLTGELSQDGT